MSHLVFFAREHNLKNIPVPNTFAALNKCTLCTLCTVIFKENMFNCCANIKLLQLMHHERGETFLFTVNQVWAILSFLPGNLFKTFLLLLVESEAKTNCALLKNLTDGDIA